jgi:aminopeptidase N
MLRFASTPALILLLGTCRSQPAHSPAPETLRPAFPVYSLDVVLKPAEFAIDFDGSITIPPDSLPRDSLVFVLDRAMRVHRLELTAPATMAGPMRLDSAGTRGRDVRWVARLPGSLPPGSPLVLRFSGGGRDTQAATLFYLGGPVVYASGWGTNWYPALGDGSVLGLGRLRVRTPPTHPTVIAGGARLVARDSVSGIHEFETTVPTFFSFLAGRFHATRHESAIPITVFTLETRPNARDQARVAGEVIRVLQHEFGRYRMREVSIVEYPDSLAHRLGFNAAGEPGMLVLKGGFLLGPPNVANYGHELGHNWWPIVATFEVPHGLMLEGLANYAAFRVVEVLEGPAAAEKFRRDGEPGFNGDINARFYFTHAAAGFDTTLVAMREGMFPQRNMAGTKAAFVFDMLAAEVGRERFRRAMAEILDRHEWKRIGLPQLVREVGAAAGRDLEWFYQQWFTRSGAPAFSLSWRATGNTVTGSITQPAPYYRVSLPIGFASTDSGSVTRVVVADGPRTDFSFTLPFPVTGVEIDPRHRVLRWIPEQQATATALAPLTRAAVHRSVEEYRTALVAVPQPDVHGFAFTAHLGLARQLLDAGQFDSAGVHLRDALSAPSRDEMQLSLVLRQH